MMIVAKCNTNPHYFQTEKIQKYFHVLNPKRGDEKKILQLLQKMKLVYLYHNTDITNYIVKIKKRYNFKLMIHEPIHNKFDKNVVQTADAISNWSIHLTIQNYKPDEITKKKLFWIYQGVRIRDNTNLNDLVCENKYGDYIISCGDMFRDYKTLLESIKDLDIKLLICCKENISIPYDCKDRIIKLNTHDLGENNMVIEILKLIKNSLFAILPLKESSEAHGCTFATEVCLMRKPLIVTKLCGVDDYIEDGKTGLLVKHQDHQDLKEKIEYLLEKDRLSEFNSNINSKFEGDKDYMRWSGFADRLINKYNELV